MGRPADAAARLYPRLARVLTAPEKWLYRSGIRFTDLHLPDFLTVGAQKAGTTWLAENLRHHPEVFIPRPQSTHYFDLHFHRSLRFYSDKFRDGAGKVKGESCPAYGVLPLDRIRAIHGLMPDTRIIFMVRNPVERAWSHALMNLVQRRGMRYEDVPDAEFTRHFTSRRSRLRSDYLAILDRWRAVFPDDQIFVGFFEDIVQAPTALLRRVFEHLGISPDVDYGEFPCRKVINRGLGIAIPEAHRRTLEQVYAADIEHMRRRFGDRVAAWRRP